MSDYRALEDFHTKHGLTKTVEESAALALKLGCHVCAGYVYEHVMAAYNQGLVTEDDISRAAIAAMRTRIRLGLFDEVCAFDNIPMDVISCKEHNGYSLETARRSMILLKNNGILPLGASRYNKIAVIGPNTDSRDALVGNYFGTAERYNAFLMGIQDAFGGRVFHSQGSHLYKLGTSGLTRPNDRIVEAVAIAQHCDVSILCIGLDANLEGEEGDAANALLQVWYPGPHGGEALEDILFGKTSPSGKLPVTFYEDADLLPDFTDYATKNRTYRFIEGNVLYPFGFGLTCSQVDCIDVSYKNGKVSVTAQNVGSVATEDVVQIYIKDNKSVHVVKNHRLCGFARIYLDASEKRLLKSKLTKLPLMWWTKQAGDLLILTALPFLQVPAGRMN